MKNISVPWMNSVESGGPLLAETVCSINDYLTYIQPFFFEPVFTKSLFGLIANVH